MSKKLGFRKALETKVKKSQVAAKKKAISIFTAMSVAHVDEEEAGSGEVRHGNGVMVCLMAMGNIYGLMVVCMSVGGFKGKIMGKGKFCWPSGATYEGEFKSGFMDGQGTFTGFSGDSYKGSWVMNLKHGQGIKNYFNGDYYEGEWRTGFQEGEGRYQWTNGIHYDGQWKNGYEGCWEDGFPKGNGTFRWPDGSSYVGVWSKDVKEMNGTYNPSDSSTEKPDWDPQVVFSEYLKECKICPGEKMSILPSKKMPHWPGMGKGNDQGRPRRMSDGKLNCHSFSSDMHDVSAISEGDSKDDDDGIESLCLEDSTSRGSLPHFKTPTKRQGQTISKGHKNYELMLNLQLGIRHSVGRPGPVISLDLKSSAFDPKEKVWTKFPPEGSKHTPPHQSSDFRWKDYCPLVFRTLRKLFDVDAADYMISICGDDALRELSSPGKVELCIKLQFLTGFVLQSKLLRNIRTLSQVLLRMLPAYYNHVRSFENTLVTKFYGLHCVKLTGTAQKKVRFVIMGNLLCTHYTIHRRFDLKGSSHGRTTSKPESEIDPSTTLKDLDLNYLFRLEKRGSKSFAGIFISCNLYYLDSGVNVTYGQVDRDCDLLEQERIMDYSLLVGFHFREVPTPLASRAVTPTGNADHENEEVPRLSQTGQDQLDSESSGGSSIRLGISMPARIEKTVRKPECETQLVGEPTGVFYDVILFFGIIDILQDYDITKKLEHAYKSMQYDPTSISAVDPKQYSKRFRDFIFKIFVEDT
ncbi:hypothetical protein CXB51_004107 [Gossypium anomalum]|uniref:Phosphatidylinositol 4-phosphate 5-kinase n=1 Tax=Gossypium anomalum TaxID=47600 RepID=A0A8J6DC32_9ROSI|nr:hypothetical protein CXB51_004107 [Gossypium anomalum]